MGYSQKDPALDDKINHLEGILGAFLPEVYFKNEHQADVIGKSPQQYSRKRRGKEGITNAELSKLFDLFRLGGSLDYRVFQLDFDSFTQALKDAKVGTYGVPSTVKDRETLIELAEPGASIGIVRATTRRSGGIGGGEFDTDVPEFFDRDRVFLEIPKTAPGHLLVLNDNAAKNTTSSLLPSDYAPDSAVEGNPLRVPTEPALPYFTIARPTGFYRIFAIWSAFELLKLLPDFDDESGAVPAVSHRDMQMLATLARQHAADPATLRVMTGEYWVR